MEKVFTGSTDIVFIFLNFFLISPTGNEKSAEDHNLALGLRYISSKIEEGSCIIVTFPDKIGKKSFNIIARP